MRIRLKKKQGLLKKRKSFFCFFLKFFPYFQQLSSSLFSFPAPPTSPWYWDVGPIPVTQFTPDPCQRGQIKYFSSGIQAFCWNPCWCDDWGWRTSEGPGDLKSVRDSGCFDKPPTSSTFPSCCCLGTGSPQTPEEKMRMRVECVGEKEKWEQAMKQLQLECQQQQMISSPMHYCFFCLQNPLVVDYLGLFYIVANHRSIPGRTSLHILSRVPLWYCSTHLEIPWWCTCSKEFPDALVEH